MFQQVLLLLFVAKFILYLNESLLILKFSISVATATRERGDLMIHKTYR